MSDDGRVLPFPSADDDALIAVRLQALYAGTPAADAAQIAACARTVLERAAHDLHGRSDVRRAGWWWGAAAAALVLVSVPIVRSRVFRTAAPTVAAATSDTQPPGATRIDGGAAVRFVLRVPGSARVVAIVGDFNGWNERATPMVQRAVDGSWSVRVPLAPGRHTYAFVVDGVRWMVDPLAPQVPDAGFGPANALIVAGESL